jgi:hypothetical protein
VAKKAFGVSLILMRNASSHARNIFGARYLNLIPSREMSAVDRSSSIYAADGAELELITKTTASHEGCEDVTI